MEGRRIKCIKINNIPPNIRVTPPAATTKAKKEIREKIKERGKEKKKERMNKDRPEFLFLLSEFEN